jgi:Protein of unknown function (DUF1203)
MPIRFVALETELVTGWRQGQMDANGQVPERGHALTAGYPCRHCMQLIAKDQPILTLAHRPFPAPQPYAEVGPIWLHADDCGRGSGPQIPAFLNSERYIIRGYGDNDRIVYGTGQITATLSIPAAAEQLFENAAIRYIHVRSASNNCYHCRIERA